MEADAFAASIQSTDYPDEIEKKGAFHGAGADYTDGKL